MRKVSFIAVALAAVSPLTGVPAQPGVGSNPPGVQGRDWDARSFRITQGHTVSVTATNISINSHPGNATSVTVYVDGSLADTYELDAATLTKSYLVSGDGPHRAMVICSNKRADANTCSLSIALVDVQSF